MVPRFIHVCESLPRNLNQRVEKYKLRAWAAENPKALWDRYAEQGFGRKSNGVGPWLLVIDRGIGRTLRKSK
jgi:hypothetical protein